MSVAFRGRAGAQETAGRRAALARPVASPARLAVSSLLPPVACLPVLASALSLDRGQSRLPAPLSPPCRAGAEGLEGERGGQAVVWEGAHPARPLRGEPSEQKTLV